MDMKQLDINQCPDDYHTPNAFKNTHKCDAKTSYVSFSHFHPNKSNFDRFPVCSHSRSRLRGFEYPFEDLITYYDGQLVESEFQNIMNDKETRYDLFKCRLAGAAGIKGQLALITGFIVFVLFYMQVRHR
jgi:hypothetical protein